MSKIRKLAMWYWLLHKRLWRKPGFLIVMCVVPCLVAGLRMAAQGERGMLTIAVYAEDSENPVTAQILEGIREEQGAIRYLFPESEEEAREAVASADANMAWIFADDLDKIVERTAESGRIEPMVTAVVQEENVLLTFAREKLCSELYPALSKAVYRAYVRNEVCGAENVTEEELRDVYEAAEVKGTLFEEVHADGSTGSKEESNYLLSPLRGILALWLVLCGLAASMYFMQDEKDGLLSRVPVSSRIYHAWGFHLAVILDAAVIMLAALWAAGLFAGWQREIVPMVLLVLAATAFCNIVRLLCRTKEHLGIVMPVLLILMMVFCPVFISIKQQQMFFTNLLPPTYYLKSIYDNYKLWDMVLYNVIAYVICFGLDRILGWGRKC